METAVIVQIITVIGSVAAVGLPLIATARKDRHRANTELVGLVNKLQKTLDEEVADNAQNYIVPFLANVEAGHKVPSEEEVRRFWECYDIYRAHGRNDYVHRQVERLQAAGKL